MFLRQLCDVVFPHLKAFFNDVPLRVGVVRLYPMKEIEAHAFVLCDELLWDFNRLTLCGQQTTCQITEVSYYSFVRLSRDSQSLSQCSLTE